MPLTGAIALSRPKVPVAVFCAAWLAVAAEGAVVAVLGTPWAVGVVVLTPLAIAAPLGVVVASRELARGERAMGGDLMGVRPWLGATLIVAVGTGVGACIVKMSVWDAIGLAWAAMFEEAVFRVALPVCVYQLLRRAGAGRGAVPAAATVAAVLFAVMPGHLSQISSPLGVAPFVCLALLLLGVVWIGRDPWLAVTTHVGVNSWMLAATLGAVSPVTARLATAAVIVPVGITLAARARPREPAIASDLPGHGIRPHA